MSDYTDGSGPVPRRPRVSDGPPPVSGVVAIVLAVVAVVAGYFILRSITDDGGPSALGNAGGGVQTPGGDDATTGSSVPTSNTVGTLAPVATEPPGLQVTGASVIVANANGRGGSAGQASRVLANSAGFEVVDPPTNATESTPDLDVSVIYYDPTNPTAQTVANSLNVVMQGGLNVAPMPDPIPVTDGNLNGAGVLLMLGKDFADMSPGDLDLTQINQGSASPPTNPPTGTTPSSTTAP